MRIYRCRLIERCDLPREVGGGWVRVELTRRYTFTWVIETECIFRTREEAEVYRERWSVLDALSGRSR